MINCSCPRALYGTEARLEKAMGVVGQHRFPDAPVDVAESVREDSKPHDEDTGDNLVEIGCVDVCSVGDDSFNGKVEHFDIAGHSGEELCLNAVAAEPEKETQDEESEAKIVEEKCEDDTPVPGGDVEDISKGRKVRKRVKVKSQAKHLTRRILGPGRAKHLTRRIICLQRPSPSTWVHDDWYEDWYEYEDSCDDHVPVDPDDHVPVDPDDHVPVDPDWGEEDNQGGWADQPEWDGEGDYSREEYEWDDEGDYGW